MKSYPKVSLLLLWLIIAIAIISIYLLFVFTLVSAFMNPNLRIFGVSTRSMIESYPYLPWALILLPGGILLGVLVRWGMRFRRDVARRSVKSPASLKT